MATKKISELTAATAGNCLNGYMEIESAAGASYKITLGATSGATNKIDADTVSGYGIGVDDGVALPGNTFNQVLKSGACYIFTSAPTGVFSGGTTGVASMISNGTYDFILAIDWTTGSYWSGQRSHGSGAFTWYKQWGTNNDGNGGQPPMPKAHIGTNTLPGYAVVAAYASAGTFVLPSGGTFIVFCLTVGASFDCTSPSASTVDILVANGGATITSGGGVTAKYIYWRLT